MNTFITHCTGVILAGGENSRMPEPKAFIKVNGRSIIQRALRTYGQLFSNSLIVTNQPEHYSHFGIRMCGDVYNIRGPMTGILTSLMNASDPWVFVSACDMPFLNKNLIEFMASYRRTYEAVVPLYKGRPEPLHAYYSSRLTKSMEKALLSGNRAMKDFLRSKRVKYLSFRELRKFDPGGKSIVNINTPRDLKAALMPEDIVTSKIQSRR